MKPRQDEPQTMTRRSLLAAALPLAAASQAFSNRRVDEQGKVVLGVATAGFRQHTNNQLAKELAKRGVHTVQMFLTQTDSDYWRNKKNLSQSRRDRSPGAGR